MDIIFFGTGKFGVPVLKRLIASGHDILAVVTQPDKKKGRYGRDVHPAPVKAFMEKASPDVEILQPLKSSDPVFIDHLRSKKADVFVVVDYGQILVKRLLDIPAKCSVNLHPSLLPKYRGASPVNRAILAGDPETGNTVIKMTERMDAGEIIVREKVSIEEEDTAPELLDRMAKSGAGLLIKALDIIETGDLLFAAQDETQATYASKLKKDDGKIEWEKPAGYILRLVKAMQPWPGAFTYLDGKMMKIFSAKILSGMEENSISPGTVLDGKKIIIKTGQGAISIDILQLEGKKKMPREEFLRGYQIAEGTVLE